MQPNNNETIAKVIGVVVLLVLVAILTTVLIKAGQDDPLAPVAPVSTAQAAPAAQDNAALTAVYRENYMDGCTGSEGASESYCRCTFNHLHNELGTQGLMEMSMEYTNDGKFTEPMMQALSSCIEEL